MSVLNRVSYLVGRVRPANAVVNVSQRKLTAASTEKPQEEKKGNQQDTEDSDHNTSRYSWEAPQGGRRQINMVLLLAWIGTCFYLPVFNYKYQQRKAA